MIEPLIGEPVIPPGTVRIPIDPTKVKELSPYIPYEIVIKPPRFDIDFLNKLSDAIIDALIKGAGLVYGYEVKTYKEDDYLIVQVIRKSPIAITPIALLSNIVPTLDPFKAIPLMIGMRAPAAGLGMIGFGALTFAIAEGVWKFMGIPMVIGGLYLIVNYFISQIKK